jgi:hypothetical protein
MKKLMMVALGMGVLSFVSSPSVSSAADLGEAINLTHQGVVTLTDYPAQGKRITAFAGPNEQEKLYGKAPSERTMESRWGADNAMGKKATGLFQDALNKAKSGGADRAAIMKLEEAIDYGKGSMHKESRLYAEGALHYLCKQNNGDPKDICDKVPKYGSYTAP